MQPSKEQSTPSREQIENASWAIMGVLVEWDDQGAWLSFKNRYWQPWADTEAGRSDALVLLAAVLDWLQSNDRVFDWPVMIREKWFDLDDALTSGNVQQIQAATFAAAAAIGAHIKGVE